MGWTENVDFVGLSNILSPILKGVGSIYQGSVGGKGYSVEAAALRKEAEYRRMVGSYKANLVREQGKEFQSSQLAIAGTQGVQLSGSPLQVLADTAYKVERNALLTKVAGETEAGSLEAEAKAYERIAKIKKRRGWLKSLVELPNVFTGLSKWNWSNRSDSNKYEIDWGEWT